MNARRPSGKLTPVHFAVDAALLRELGERLVGRPHIALAELIKNAYDADATLVEVDIGDDLLVVADDGHGMTRKEFKDRWMRIGSPHKERERFSRALERPLTGSKGIGRLAVQFLGSELEMWTQAEHPGAPQLYAEIDWSTARTKKLVTQASALVGTLPKSMRRRFPGEAEHGTVIEIADLSQEWDEFALKDLAQQVWALQPPFSQPEGGFEIKLTASDQSAVKGFESQIYAYLDVWYARIKGELKRLPDTDASLLQAELMFSDGERHVLRREFTPARVNHAAIEIRMYYTKYRQPRGLTVGELREYFNNWGGVHVYDSDFRLPYYGPDEDWLGIEMDYSHRLSLSKLLPESEQVKNGLRFLPTNSRIFGEVRVSTSDERRNRIAGAGPGDVLQIQASRDRLVDNRAFDQLREAVRTTLDWYANREAARQNRRREEAGEAERVETATEALSDVVESLEPKLGKSDYASLSQAVSQVRAAEHAESAQRERQVRLMATLASAGAASLAYEHEVGKQLGQLESISRRLRQMAKEDPRLAELSDGLRSWMERARRARGLFSPLINEEDRERAKALPARRAIEQIVRDQQFILGPVGVHIEIDDNLRLPKARLAEWSAIFQNAFTNAVAAMRETPAPRIAIVSGGAGRHRYIDVFDNGVGVDVEDADRLFEPFERGDTSEVGAGSGLGLAIMRMLANAIGVRARFVESPEDWSTRLRLSWSVKK